MSYSITERARAIANSKLIGPHLVIEIEGYPLFLTSSTLVEVARYGGDDLYYGMPGLTYGGVVKKKNQADLLSLEATTTNITQQLMPDEGASSSTTQLTVGLVNKDNVFSDLVTPRGQDDIISKKASVYLGAEGMSFPEDYIRIFVGNVTDTTLSAGLVKLKISHPENEKRSEIYLKASTELSADMRYRSRVIQGINYRTRTDFEGNPTIAYVAGGTHNSEAVTVGGGGQITIAIAVGQTTNNNIRTALENSLPARFVVDYSIESGQGAVVVTAMGATPMLTDSLPQVLNTDGFLLPKDLVESYVRIGDEIFKYTGLTETGFTGVTRGHFGTIETAHEAGDAVESFYVLGDATNQSNAITLGLKVLISGSANWVREAVATDFGMGPEPTNQNSIFFQDRKLAGSENVRVGDKITITGATTPANNLTDAVITAIVDEYEGTRIVVSEPLTAETESEAVATFHSQYDTLPDGLGMSPDQVDIDEFQKIAVLFNSTVPNYQIFLKDSISGKDLFNKEILFPAAMYSIPRKGRVSIGKLRPPISDFETKTLDETTVLNAKDLQIERSSNQNFYNAVSYKFDEDAVEDRFLAGRVMLSANSTNRIKVGNKVYKIESKGLRPTPENEVIIKANSERLLDRFQYGAESIKGVKVPFSVGWATEIGDTVIVQGLQMFDTKTGERTLSPRVMEITNRAFNFRQGIITLDLTDTAYAMNGRYGTISPSSIVAETSTTTELIIKKSFGTTELEKERDKWEGYQGMPVIVHREDWSEFDTVTMLGFSPSNDNMMLLGSPLSFTPGLGDIVDIAHYDEASDYQKAVHTFANPHALIEGPIISQIQFHTDSPAAFFEGAIVVVHNRDWSNTSLEITVASVVGSIVTLDSPIGFLPNIGDEVDLIGFVSDGGLPYRLL